MAETGNKRLGTLALEKGWITQEQLLMAMNIQILEDIEKGDHRRLGRILCELDLVSTDRIDQLVEIIEGWRSTA